jgi:putative endonuclease
MISRRKIRGGRRILGFKGETLAAKYFISKGCELLCRNYRCRAGELDLVFLDGLVLRFVEVKSRRRKAGYVPADNLSIRQSKRNYAAAAVFRRITNTVHLEARFDLVEITYDGRLAGELLHRRDYLPPVKASSESGME